MSALGAPDLLAAIEGHLRAHEATAGMEWPEEGAGAVPYGRASFVSGVRADTWTTGGAEQLFQVDYWARGESAALAAAAAIDAALRAGPVEAEGYGVLTLGTSTVILDESDESGHAFHAAVTPRLMVYRIATAEP